MELYFFHGIEGMLDRLVRKLFSFDAVRAVDGPSGQQYFNLVDVLQMKTKPFGSASGKLRQNRASVPRIVL